MNADIIAADIANICAAHLPWQDLRGKTVLVTGGGGFLAAYLVRALCHANRMHQLGLRVVATVRSPESNLARLAGLSEKDGLSLFVQDASQVLAADFPRADFVIHSASHASPKYYGVDPVGTLAPNTVGTFALLRHAQNTGAERFMFFSSSEVYGAPIHAEQNLHETEFGTLDCLQVRSCYAESKRIGETMCAAWAQQHGLHTLVVRPFHTYGPGMALDDGRVFCDFVADILAGRNIILKSDGLAQRAFCYCADATLGFLTVLLRGGKAEAYNIANPQEEYAIRDLAKLLTELFPQKELRVAFENKPASGAYLKSAVMRSRPCIKKIRALGWEPKTTVPDGFRRTIESFSSDNGGRAGV
jgi:UDP-glucuronate decarboxylase